MTRQELNYYLHWLVGQAGSQKVLAQRLGISTAYLNDVLRMRREPGKKLLDAIGICATVTYDYVDPNSDAVQRKVAGQIETEYQS